MARLAEADCGGANFQRRSLSADWPGRPGERGFRRDARRGPHPRGLLGEPNDAKLFFASLEGSDLRTARLDRADLRDANLSHCDLRKVRLSNALLTGADFTGADLREADLSSSNLDGVEFYLANLSGADLSGADLSAASLKRATMAGAKLKGAKIHPKYLPMIKTLNVDFSGVVWIDRQEKKQGEGDDRTPREK